MAHVSPSGAVQDADGTYERWSSRNDCEVFLSRPDFYVFGAGDHADIPRLVAQLRDALSAEGNHLR